MNNEVVMGVLLLSTEQLNVVMEALHELPAKKSVGVINLINTQLAGQQEVIDTIVKHSPQSKEPIAD